jgi:hypothetical protein
MSFLSQNGNGGGQILPPTTRISGRSLVHRQLDARQRACLAAGVLDGTSQFDPSVKQLADIFGVSIPYIMTARKLSLGKRIAILRGWDPTSFAELRRQPQLRLPGPHMCIDHQHPVGERDPRGWY